MEKENKEDIQLKADSISITYFTDPLCCWSWVFEPEWEKLLTEYKDHVTYRICMGGLLPSWNNYNDEVNSISKPLQMGPMWMHASVITGIHIQHDIWIKDPPSSSYPACIAVKAAQLQSAEAGEKYLYLLRSACMKESKNIAKQSVLLEAAALLAEDKILDIELFKQDLFGSRGKEEFRKDLQEVKYYGINRFPALVFKNKATNNARLITGFHSFEAIIEILNNFL